MKFRRVAGAPPNATKTEATVKAVVATMMPASGARYGFSDAQSGGFTPHMRHIIVMADDLANAGFPMPPADGDDLFVLDSDEKLSAVQVDLETRAVAGAIDIVASGVK